MGRDICRIALLVAIAILLYALPARVEGATLELRESGTDSTEIRMWVGQWLEVDIWVDTEGERISGMKRGGIP